MNDERFECSDYPPFRVCAFTLWPLPVCEFEKLICFAPKRHFSSDRFRLPTFRVAIFDSGVFGTIDRLLV